MKKQELIMSTSVDVTIDGNKKTTKTLKYAGIIDEYGIFHLKSYLYTRKVEIVADVNPPLTIKEAS